MLGDQTLPDTSRLPPPSQVSATVGCVRLFLASPRMRLQDANLKIFSEKCSSLTSVAVIRDFPKALQSDDYDTILEACLAGIRNCVNLRACTWTRHGSLTSAVLGTLASCSRLEELEINGEHAGYYDPTILPQFSHLRKLSLIMPSAAVANMLLPWTRNIKDTLRHLSVICKASQCHIPSWDPSVLTRLRHSHPPESMTVFSTTLHNTQRI